MSPSRARFVTVCQQLLALGVVVVALVPATRVVSLDVVGVQPGADAQPTVQVGPGPRSVSVRTPRSVRVVERHAGSGGQAVRHALGRSDGIEAVRTGP